MNDKNLKPTDLINIGLFTYSYYIALTHVNILLLVITEIFFLWYLKERSNK